MPLVWDAPLVMAVAREMEDLLRGDRLRAHHFDWDRRRLVLFFRSGTLTCHLHPRDGRVLLQAPVDPSPESRPLQARVEGVEAPPDERILRIRLRRVRGRKLSLQVVLELMTNQWNALLVEGQDAIIRHLLWTRRLEERALAIGQPYRPPEPSRRMGIHRPLSRETWEKTVSQVPEEERRSILLDQVAFTSSLNAPALLAEGPEEGYRLWHQLRTLDPLAPCLLHTTYGDNPYPIVLQTFDYAPFRTILGAMQEVPAPGAMGAEEGRARLLERLDRALGQARGRARGLHRELEDAPDPQGPRQQANLLLARLHQLSRGQEQVTLTGFHGEPVELSLDPTLSPQENADALYREAARLERIRERLPDLLSETEGRIRELEELRTSFEEGQVDPEDLDRKVPDVARKGSGGSPEGEERLPFQRYRSSGGLEIRVGRGPRDNDDLTFRHSDPEDIWLHARQASGAHVILRWSREGNPPRNDLAEAATLAALNSQARNAGTVPVDWTRRKYVRKPRKAPPGAVVPDRVQTVFVRPDPELPQRLGREDY